jgi:hypothetical protein
MSIEPDLKDDNTLTPLGVGPGLYFPQSQDVLSLSPQMRWELTRRHPYYLNCWRQARSYHRYLFIRREQKPTTVNLELAAACAGVVRGLGVRIDGIDFPDPALSWDEQPFQMRESNGASAMTPRELVLQLLARLPDDERKKLGVALQEVTAINASFAVNRLRGESLDNPQLDLVMYSPAASQNTILPAVKEIITQAQERQTRPRPDAVDEQLKVWDLREGWTGSGYDGQQERRLNDIVQEIGEPLSTVKDRYKRAFARIVGRPFTTELWMMLFLTLKVNESLRQRWRTRHARQRRTDVTLARAPRSLKSNTEVDAIPEPATSDHDQTITSFNMDMIDLLKKGRSPSDVAARLELYFSDSFTSEKRAKLIEYIKSAPKNRLE